MLPRLGNPKLPSQSQIHHALHSVLQSSTLSEFDQSFLLRMYDNGDLEKYLSRVSALGLTNFRNVLDVGCGFGQWSIALAEFNISVTGIDIDQQRVSISNDICHYLEMDNINFIQGEMDKIVSPPNSFDLIFSYGALPLSPFVSTLQTFYHLLMPGGTLYFSAYGLGHMLNNILHPRNATSDFSPREWAISAIDSTLNYLYSGHFSQASPRDSLFIPKKIAYRILEDSGFCDIRIFPEGSYSCSPEIATYPFAPSQYNQDYEAVYEVLCRKPF